MDKDERNIELQEREDDIKILNINNMQQKRALVLDNLLNKETLKRYSSNKLISICHIFQRVFLKLLSINDPGYNEILVQVEFAQFYAKMVKEFYFVIVSSIHINTEKLHVLMVRMTVLSHNVMCYF